MSNNDGVETSVAQLLELRHLPAPDVRTTPESNGAWLGNFRSKTRGHGTDYDDLRQYSAGDEIRHIDWRASARTQELHTRVYKEEKDHRATVLCDLRHCMYTGSVSLRSTRAVTLAARLLWQACQGGTQITLVIITASGVCELEPGSGHTTAIRGCSALAEAHQETVNALRKQNQMRAVLQSGSVHASATPETQSSLNDSTRTAELKSRQHDLPVFSLSLGPSLDTVLTHLLNRDAHRSTLLWITGLDNTGEQFYNKLGSTTLHNNPVVVYVDDPMLNTSLPPGEFHYRPFMATDPFGKTFHRSARVLRGNQQTLTNTLRAIQQQRIQRFDSLMIPLLTTAMGDDAVVAALRHQAVIP